MRDPRIHYLLEVLLLTLHNCVVLLYNSVQRANRLSAQPLFSLCTTPLFYHRTEQLIS